MRTGEEVLVSMPVMTASASAKPGSLRLNRRIPCSSMVLICSGKALRRFASLTPQEKLGVVDAIERSGLLCSRKLLTDWAGAR